MTTAMQLADTTWIDCAGCAEAADYLARMRRERGAHLTVRCDTCHATLEARRERRAQGPRAPTADELEQRAARDLDSWLRDAAAIARWRAHESRDRKSALGALQGTVATVTHAEADASRGPRVEGDRERDLRRGAALDAVLRGLEAGCADRRSVAVLVHCVERMGAERTRFRSPAELVGAAFMTTRALRGHVAKGDAALANAAHGGPLLARAVVVWTEARGVAR